MKSFVHMVAVVTVLFAPVISLEQADLAQTRALVRIGFAGMERSTAALAAEIALLVRSGFKPTRHA